MIKSVFFKTEASVESIILALRNLKLTELHIDPGKVTIKKGVDTE